MQATMPAETAERLSDVADRDLLEFDYWLEDDVRACVPYDLAESIADLLQCKGSSLEAYEEARRKLELAMGRRFMDLV